MTLGRVAALLVLVLLLPTTASYTFLFYPCSERTHILVHLRLAAELATRNHTIHFLTADCHEDFARTAAAQSAPAADIRFIAYNMNCTYHEQEKRKYQFVNPIRASLAILDNVFKRADDVLSNNTLMEHLQQLAPEIDFMVNDILSYGMLLSSKLGKQYVDLDVGTAGAMWEPVFHGAEPSTSFIPAVGTFFPTNGMNFWQRAVNLLVTKIVRGVVSNAYWHPNLWLQTMIKKHNINLRWPYNRYMMMLVNSNFALEPSRAIPPNIKYVGPMLPEDPKPLPIDLRQWLDSKGSSDVVYISFGGTLEAPAAAIKTLVTVIESMPNVQFVWKLRSEAQSQIADQLGNLTNSYVSNWLPQNDLLGHPSVKAFITQGGYLSMAEAGFHGVPIIGLPFIPGQGELIRFAQDQGWAARLPRDTLVKGQADALRKVVSEVLGNDSYTRAAAVISQRLRANPRPFRQEAADWVENAASVSEHGPFLHPDKINQYWYQQVMLDVVLLYAAILVMPAMLIWRRWFVQQQRPASRDSDDGFVVAKVTLVAPVQK